MTKEDEGVFEVFDGLESCLNSELTHEVRIAGLLRLTAFIAAILASINSCASGSIMFIFIYPFNCIVTSADSVLVA